MDGHRGSFVPRSSLAVPMAWALRLLEALVPAYAFGGREGLRDA
jgi:hypothetical protein